MTPLRHLCLGVLVGSLACRVPTPEIRPEPDAALLGCWQLSEAVLRDVASYTPTQGSHGRIFEIASFPLGRYAPIRVLGLPDRRTDDGRVPHRLHGWRPVAPDSLEVVWTAGPNGMEIRLQVRGDSATGEFFYHGDILLPGQSTADLRRSPKPISAVRVACLPVLAG